MEDSGCTNPLSLLQVHNFTTALIYILQNLHVLSIVKEPYKATSKFCAPIKPTMHVSNCCHNQRAYFWCSMLTSSSLANICEPVTYFKHAHTKTCSLKFNAQSLHRAFYILYSSVYSNCKQSPCPSDLRLKLKNLSLLYVHLSVGKFYSKDL